jgi:hypothetical protein
MVQIPNLIIFLYRLKIPLISEIHDAFNIEDQCLVCISFLLYVNCRHVFEILSNFLKYKNLREKLNENNFLPLQKAFQATYETAAHEGFLRGALTRQCSAFNVFEKTIASP